MDQPVTTNPFVIMLINMTVVFIVLISLSFLIRLIHIVDPTKPKEVPVEEAPKVVATPPPPPAPIVEEPIEEGIPAEVIAVIAAAVGAYGYSVGQIHAIHPVHNDHSWEHSVTYPNRRLAR